VVTWTKRRDRCHKTAEPSAGSTEASREIPALDLGIFCGEIHFGIFKIHYYPMKNGDIYCEYVVNILLMMVNDDGYDDG
jgi:hypothetical protein